MPRWAKVVLIVSIVGYVVLTVVFMAFYVRSVRRTVQRDDRSREARLQEWRALMDEAQEFGRGKTSEACIAESLNRLRSEEARSDNGVRAPLFLSMCLETATMTPETCAGVPPRSELWRSLRWQYEECSRRGWPRSQRCMFVMSALQRHCTRGR